MIDRLNVVLLGLAIFSSASTIRLQTAPLLTSWISYFYIKVREYRYA
jgi:hypothetical protein